MTPSKSFSESQSTKYDDIIDHSRPVSQKYPRMSIAGRAAQFAPYKTIVAYHDHLDQADQTGNAVFQESEIIPDQDYYEYTENFDNTDQTEENIDIADEFITPIKDNSNLDFHTDHEL